MHHFQYYNNILHAEKINLNDIALEFGTPCYVYSRLTIEENWRAFDSAISIPHKICYAVKANSNIAILSLLNQLGSGFDIVSIGELERVLIAGADPKRIVFSGVGKQTSEIQRALDVGIYCFNVESLAEIQRIESIAKQKNKVANIALRINPDINAETHPYIATGLKENKFGIDVENISIACAEINKLAHVNLIGIGCHIGSQLTSMAPFLQAVERVLEIADQLTQSGFALQHINLGGGLGVRYQDEQPPSINEYIGHLSERLGNCNLNIILEPGRAIIANAGILLTRIEYLKHGTHKNFAIIDAAMNDFMRPALYDAWQNILPVHQDSTIREQTYDIVGPVCESADFLGKNRQLALKEGSLLAICSAGAYGFSMSSNYNSRPRAAEVMVAKEKSFLIRRRETIDELFANEKLIL